LEQLSRQRKEERKSLEEGRKDYRKDYRKEEGEEGIRGRKEGIVRGRQEGRIIGNKDGRKAKQESLITGRKEEGRKTDERKEQRNKGRNLSRQILFKERNLAAIAYSCRSVAADWSAAASHTGLLILGKSMAGDTCSLRKKEGRREGRKEK
jgi:hypothetical protein